MDIRVEAQGGPHGSVGSIVINGRTVWRTPGLYDSSAEAMNAAASHMEECFAKLFQAWGVKSGDAKDDITNAPVVGDKGPEVLETKK